ncbi:MAG: enoyl-CoA hydratase/isomerase family protein [Patescibacteria group bacterium]
MEFIKTQFDDGLMTVTLDRPPLNILNIAMMNEINEVLERCCLMQHLKVFLFNAEGKHFCAGVDIGEHMGDTAGNMIRAFHNMFKLLHKLEAITVASVHGNCLGGGMELAVFCDMVVAGTTAQFGQPEIKVGVFPPVAVQLLPRIIGMKPAIELILSGKTIDPHQCKSMGLVNVVTGDLISTTKIFVKPYLDLSAAVIRLTKRAIREGLSVPGFGGSLKLIEELYLGPLMDTHDANEGLTAFMEKRKPEWKNE